MDEVTRLIASVTHKAERLLDNLDVGSKMTIRLDKKTTFTGTVKSAKIKSVGQRGKVVQAIFTVTLVSPLGRERDFDLSRIPTRN